MKIKALNVYPIKALRPIPLESATLTPQGILHDRTYMLFKVNPDSSLRKMQLSTFPQCALFSQEIVSSSPASGESGDTILVTYNTPNPPLVDKHPLQDTVLFVPLVPDTASFQPVSIDLHGSPAEALRMGDPYDAFFSACFGFPVILVHIGSGRRGVLGTFAPASSSPASSSKQQPPSASSSLLSSITSFLPSIKSPEPRNEEERDPAWLTFTDCAPYLITSTSSLSHPSLAPFKEYSLMPKFRPNIVVDDPAEAPFAEDFWAELSLPGSGSGSGTGGPTSARLLLTANCGRCSSLNVDYDTGRTADGQEGTLLKTLMRDRRVDPGHKYAPVFGRYAFLAVDGAEEKQQQSEIRVHVGDEIVVSRRSDERTVFDWDFSVSAKKVAAVA
ncbi:MOSC domain-containing protein [Colletotrichum graminicola]|uniref:MOSC domain-containing protein n=1 Tax=Colletotrichum graminicola (strain M1.001 / M2 / FGSC 10212) TaxID=645133 RepID=E3QIA2_COLGM|nr:MOSC domain-containing protein [Colletotrichum graminicola M1.001]EFQ30717.1 MOSC domain-containing protein [Colletotrichum graminicola M1.001]WDK21464.1 MOSC domain-containing protein [Colletotrichum graminicola]